MTLKKNIINVTTAALKNLSGYDASKIYLDKGFFDIELSSGIYLENQVKKIKKISKKNFSIHNYFPPPKEPFVMNLASLNDEIYNLTHDFIISSIQNSADLDCNFYSFHPGFIVDISVKEIGIKTTNTNKFNRSICKEILVERINKISIKAKECGVELLLENNVMNKRSFDIINFNATLMSDPVEIDYFMTNTNNNVNLLMDIAHLKVSSNVLKFDLNDALDSASKWIKAYHLSDNDGFNDTNQPINQKTWFLNKLKNNCLFYTLEVYTDDLEVLKNQINILSKTLSDNEIHKNAENL